jgi:hypothetical protein
MTKKTVLFIAMIAVSIVLILSFVGWTRVSRKIESEMKNVEMVNLEKPKEIKIVAIEEKAVSSIKKPRKINKKPVKKNNFRNKSEAKKNSNKKATNKNLRSKKLFSASFRINQNMIKAGRTLIDKKVSIPIIQASYDRIGFDTYLKQMKDMGGRLFVGDAPEQKILAEAIVDNHNGIYSFGMDEGIRDKLHGLALFRPREIVNEVLVDEILDFARKTFGDRDLRCVILLPLDKEAAILGANKEYFKNSGYDISQFDMVWGHYFQEDRGFGLKMEKGRLSKTQEIIYLDMILNM